MNIDKHIDEALAIEAPAGLSAAKLKMFNVCKAYLAVRPVLKFARGLLFFKPRWQKVIDILFVAMDEVCPNEN